MYYTCRSHVGRSPVQSRMLVHVLRHSPKPFPMVCLKAWVKARWSVVNTNGQQLQALMCFDKATNRLQIPTDAACLARFGYRHVRLPFRLCRCVNLAPPSASVLVCVDYDLSISVTLRCTSWKVWTRPAVGHFYPQDCPCAAPRLMVHSLNASLNGQVAAATPQVTKGRTQHRPLFATNMLHSHSGAET